MRENYAGYLFILPTFVMFVLLFYIPIVQGVFITFTNATLGGTSYEFVGLDNYVWMFSNDLFVFALGWTLVFVFSVTALQLLVGLMAALLLNEIRTGLKETFSAIMMSPYFSAPLAGGVIWFWFLDSNYGLAAMLAADLGTTAPGFLAEGFWPYVSLIVAQTWHDYAYAAIIYLAALASVPRDQYEAAALDGAGRLRRFRDVTLPHLLIPTVIILALRTAWNVAEFAQPFELTAGGPGTRTMLLSILTYRTAFVNLSFSRAFAIGVVMILLAMFAGIVYINAIRQEEELYV
ncbi:sugar ABC transporter permease [Halorarum salinum]|uniref:Sugar ABC transporter permease n=2 Tax=Halorarum salinum TaxID=2743089 RepID=A0A7D5LDF8_9EURY|nr:sugar ABC transporter permease [Halobaculum salinum]